MNFCYVKFEDFILGILEVVVIDVFFILLKLMLFLLYVILKEEGEVIVLIKF